MGLEQMIIVISGEPGSGKSTVAKTVAKKLGYEFFSGGDFRGEIARKHNMTIDQLNEVGKKELWTDKEVDDLIVSYGKTKDKLVIDSWLAWHFIPHAFKIFLAVDPEVSAQRVFKNQRPDEPHQETIEGTQKMLAARYKQSVERYKKWYNVDITDRKHYDCIIDTSKLTQSETVSKVMDYIAKKGKH